MDDKVFIPFSEALLAAAGSPPGELVPYQLNYRCLRLPNGVYEFTMEEELSEAAMQSGADALQRERHIVHAA